MEYRLIDDLEANAAMMAPIVPGLLWIEIGVDEERTSVIPALTRLTILDLSDLPDVVTSERVIAYGQSFVLRTEKSPRQFA